MISYKKVKKQIENGQGDLKNIKEEIKVECNRLQMVIWVYDIFKGAINSRYNEYSMYVDRLGLSLEGIDAICMDFQKRYNISYHITDDNPNTFRIRIILN